MVDMAVHQILPAAIRYSQSLCDSIHGKMRFGAPSRAESRLLQTLSEHTDGLYDAVERLKTDLTQVPKDAEKAAKYYHDVIVPGMNQVRREADLLEELTDKSCWPYPTYSDLLFY